MRKSKNRNFYHILVSPGDAPGAITLNVVWMERECDAYKLSRCMCQSIYYHFWDTARYLWKKSSFYHTPLAFDAPVWKGSRRNIGTPFGMENENGVAIRWLKSFEDMFIRFDVIHERDGQTDGQTLRDSKYRACIASRRKNASPPMQCNTDRTCGSLTLYTTLFHQTCGSRKYNRWNKINEHTKRT